MDTRGISNGGRRSRRSLVGEIFGRLTVIRDSGLRNTSGSIRWECRCSCGNTTYAVGAALKRGEYKSCGCWTKDRMRITPPGRKHGATGTPTYASWVVMRRRCLDKNFKDYPLYGGRGIKICSRWLKSFANFLEDMGERPEGYTLDRVDCDKGYSKENCRWASRLTQGNNTRRNHYLEYGGERKTLAEWSRVTGISYTKLRARINVLKWPASRALEMVDKNGKDYQNRNNPDPRVRVRSSMSGPARIHRKRVRKP